MYPIIFLLAVPVLTFGLIALIANEFNSNV